MKTPLTENEVRALMSSLVEEIEHAAPNTSGAVRHAKRRLARNLVAGTLAVAAFAYGSLSLASRVSRQTPVAPTVSPTAPGLGIWTMDREGKNAIRLTAGSEDRAPAWSPDGTRIAFERTTGGNLDLWSMDADGSHLTRLTKTTESDLTPTWSPDGKRIAFARRLTEDHTAIFSIAADGSDDHAMADGAFPTFSPDGRWLAFQAGSNDSSEIWVGSLGAESFEAHPIDTEGSAQFPTWIDDNGIAFKRGDEYFVASPFVSKVDSLGPADAEDQPRRRMGRGPRGELLAVHGDNAYVIGRSTRTSERLTFDPSIHDGFPSWNERAKRIVLSRMVDPGTAAFVMNADGSNVTRLTNGERIDGAPVASPDGKHIAFGSTRDGFASTYVMNADGSEQRQLTTDTAGHIGPVWSPDGLSLFVMNLTETGEFGVGKLAAANANPVTEIMEPRRFFSRITLSANGSRFAYAEGVEGSSRNLFVANADGSNAHAIVGGYISYPTWGPGEQIAYLDGKSFFVIRADGSGKRKIRDYEGASIQGLWWGSGPEILFTNNYDVYALNPSTGAVRTVAALPGNQYNPSWTPDGRILFNSDR